MFSSNEFKGMTLPKFIIFFQCPHWWKTAQKRPDLFFRRRKYVYKLLLNQLDSIITSFRFFFRSQSYILGRKFGLLYDRQLLTTNPFLVTESPVLDDRGPFPSIDHLGKLQLKYVGLGVLLGRPWHVYLAIDSLSSPPT